MCADDEHKVASPAPSQKDVDDSKAEERIRALVKVVCICKGINLGRVLKGLDGSDSVADVNRKVGTGSGGCQGERCGPRIKLLLQKMKEAKDRSK